jgi:hypothetical protein
MPPTLTPPQRDQEILAHNLALEPEHRPVLNLGHGRARVLMRAFTVSTTFLWYSTLDLST